MRRQLYALVTLWAVATALPALAALPTTSAGILGLVRSTKQLEIDTSLPNPSGDKNAPWVRLSHAPEGTNGGYIAAAYAQRGTLADRTRVLAVPLDSSGSGRVFTQVIFSQRGAGPPRYVGFLSSGGHLAVHVMGGAIVAEYPDYAANDANCCPSRYLHEKYAIRNGKLQLVSRWRTKQR